MKTVIITGSNSGIGFELAKKLISENYFVILACRNREKGLDAEKRLGIKSKFIEIDLSNYESIDTFSRQIRNKTEYVFFRARHLLVSSMRLCNLRTESTTLQWIV